MRLGGPYNDDLPGRALRAPGTARATELSRSAAGTADRIGRAMVGSARGAFRVDGAGRSVVRIRDPHPGCGCGRHDHDADSSPYFQHETPPVTRVWSSR